MKTSNFILKPRKGSISNGQSSESGKFKTEYGRQVKCRREPQDKGKDKNFWHILGDDKSGAEAELRRYERIRWPKPIVLNRNDDTISIKIWPESDHHGAVGKLRHHIWFNDEYLVVIEEREKYYLFITAYPTNREHSRRKLEKRYIENKSDSRI